MRLFSSRKRRRQEESENVDRHMRVARAANAFYKASTLLVDQENYEGKKEFEEIVIGFFFGVIDALCTSEKLGDTETLVAATMFFQQTLELDAGAAGAAGSAVGLGMELSNDESGREVLQIGGRAVLSWIARGDENAPLILAELLSERIGSS